MPVPSDPRTVNKYEYLIGEDQPFEIHLGDFYDLKFNTQGFLSELYTLEVAEAKFKYLFEWARFHNWSDDKIMSLRHFPACWHDALWRMSGSFKNYEGRPGSRGNIIVPAGRYPTNYHCWIAAGQYRGHGPSIFYTSGGTEIIADHNNWIDEGPHNLFMTTSSVVVWEGSDQMFTAWVEGGSFKGFRLMGAKTSDYYDPSYESSGLVLGGYSEVCSVDQVWCEHFNDYGFKLGNTPGDIQNISSFSNNLGAVGWTGGNGLSNTRISMLSCDDNPTVIRIRPENGSYGGGTLKVEVIKSETNSRTPFKQQIILDAQRNETTDCRVNIIFDQITYSASWAKTHAPFVLDVDTFSKISVGQFIGWGCDYIIHDIRNQKQYSSNPPYKGSSFTYDLKNGGELTADWNAQVSPNYATERLAGRRWVDGEGHWTPYDFLEGTPEYIYTGDPFDTNPEPIYGCTDPTANNYNPAATEDDGSCTYNPEPIYGCTDPDANNYNPNATEDDGSCTYDPDPVPGCTDPLADNYNPNATIDDGSCQYTQPPIYRIVSSNNSDRSNSYDLHGSVVSDVEYVHILPENDITRVIFYHAGTEKIENKVPWDFKGGTAANANPWDTTTEPSGNHEIRAVITTPTGDQEITANFVIDNGTQPPPIEGCTDPDAENYNPDAEVDDGSCTYAPPPVPGCTDPNAINYNPNATVDDGSCQYVQPPVDGTKVLLVYGASSEQSSKASNYKGFYDQFNIYDISTIMFDLTLGSNNGGASDGRVNELRNVINANHPDAEWVVLMDESIFRGGHSGGTYGVNSINGCLALGVSTSSNLRTNPLFDYMGNNPYTDTGTRGYTLLSWEAFMKNKDNFKAVSDAQNVTWINEDTRSQNYRKQEMIDGSDVQLPQGYLNTLIDQTNGGWSNRWMKNMTNVLSQITGTYFFDYEETNTYVDGGILSNLTSYGGCINGKTPQNQDIGQTPITNMFQWGYVAAEGTIREPWISGKPKGGIPPQFIEPVRLAERYFTGMSIQQIMHSCIEQTDWTLIMGDPLFIPYDGDYIPPDIEGCMDETASNYNPNATIPCADCCEYVEPGDIIWGTDFSTYTKAVNKLQPMPEGNLQIESDNPMYGLSYDDGDPVKGFHFKDYNRSFPISIPGVSQIIIDSDLEEVNMASKSLTRFMINGVEKYLTWNNGEWNGGNKFFGIDGQECSHTKVGSVYTIDLPQAYEVTKIGGPNPMIGWWKSIVYK